MVVKIILLYFTIFILFAYEVNAATYYVTKTGSDNNSCVSAQSLSNPKLTIRNGMSCIGSGDVLSIRNGTYVEGISSNSQTIPTGTRWSNAPLITAYLGDNVTIRPGGGGEVLAFAHPYVQYVIFNGFVIDATGVTNGVGITNGVHHVRIQNSEIKNATRQGIVTSYGSAAAPNNEYLEFLNLKVHDNGTTVNLDHGFYFQGSSNLVEDCEIYNNAAYGITVYSGSSAMPIDNNIIRKNYVHNNNRLLSGRGGIEVSGNGNLVQNNIIVANGEGIQAGFGTASSNKIYNNTVYDNSGFGIAVSVGKPSNEIKNNILYSNGISIQDGGTGTIKTANLMANPVFVNASGEDFHIQSSSPAIDAGVTVNVADDHDDNVRPFGSSYDIGAYEYTVGVLPPTAPIDLQVIP